MRFSASEMPRLVSCPGSKSLQKQYPDTSRREATEGTVAAAVAEDCFKSGGSPVDYLGTSRQNVYIDQDMVHHLSLYVDHCRSLGRGIAEDKQEMNTGFGELVGIPDYWFWDSAGCVLYVRDLKYGHGWVEVFENYQLLSYALLLMHSHVNRINLGIVQPRANHPDGPIRVWEFSADDIRPYRNWINDAIERAAMPEPPVQTGNHCRYCRALLHCHAARNAAGGSLDYAGLAGHGPLEPEQFGPEMNLLDRAVTMLTQRKAAMEAEGLAMIKAGKILPGWEARSTMGAMAWGPDAIAAGDMLGVDLRKPAKAITPKQAVDRGILTARAVRDLAPRKPGAMKLKRVDIGAARRIISGLT